MKRIQILVGFLFCLLLLTGCRRDEMDSEYQSQTQLPTATQLINRSKKANKGTLAMNTTMSVEGKKGESEYKLIGHNSSETDLSKRSGYFNSDSKLYKNDELLKSAKEENWYDNKFGYYRYKESYDDWTDWRRVSRGGSDSNDNSQIDRKMEKFYNVRTKGKYYIVYINEDAMHYYDARNAMSDYLRGIFQDSEIKIPDDDDDQDSPDFNVELAYDKRTGALIGGIYEYSDKYMKYKMTLTQKYKRINVPRSVTENAIDE